MVEVKNLEIGAGCGNFGKLFYPKCILTDLESVKKKCSIHFIDIFCDAYEVHKVFNNEFNAAILCNPYNYGFQTRDMSIELFSAIVNVLILPANIFVIYHERNRFGTVSVFIPYIREQYPDLEISVTEEKIDSETKFPNYVFMTESGRPTKPNCFITIKISRK